MPNSYKTFGLFGRLYSATTKQFLSFTCKQNCRLTIPLLVLLTTCLYCLPIQAKYGGGSGTADDPYLILTGAQINAIGTNPDDWDKHFRLMADIDLADFAGTSFNIIGTDWNNPFTGVFDGNGKNILNFSYSSTNRDWAGLFGYVFDPDAQIRGLRLIGPNVVARAASNIGSIVGWLRDGTVINCHVEDGSVSGNIRVGGLVGSNDGTIANCYATGNVLGNDEVGGLVGQNSETITNCSASGSVSGNDNVGGLVGENWTTITRCASSGIVVGSSYVGGLVGWNYGGDIMSCCATGSVVGHENVGGLAGLNSDTGIIANCYSTSQVSATSSVGGLVGTNGTPYLGCTCTFGAISNCFSAGSVTGQMIVGGLVGNNQFGPIAHSCWDSETSGRSSMCGAQDDLGTGCGYSGCKTTAQMQLASTYTSAGWDFVAESINGTDDIWCICEGMDYPKLTWQFVTGDFDGDGKVSLVDFAIFATRWLGTDSGLWCGGTNLNNDADVDFIDLQRFTENWLTGKQWVNIADRTLDK